MDMIEIDAASNTGVDKVRETIIDKVNVAPAQGRYRVYIIDEVHMLSASAFNALLKTLEEPPEHAIFILATTETHKVPATIISRCQRFDFRRVGPADIVKRLQYVATCENFVLPDDAAQVIARHAEGALRDALTLLEQVLAYSGAQITLDDVRLVLGGVPQELIDVLIERIAAQDAAGVLRAIDSAVDAGASFSQLARDLTAYVRDLLLISVGYSGDATAEVEGGSKRKEHSRQLGRPRTEALLSALREAGKEMRETVDHRLILELTLVRAAQAAVAPVLPVGVPAVVVPRRIVPEATAAPAPAPEPPREMPAPRPQQAPEPASGGETTTPEKPPAAETSEVAAPEAEATPPRKKGRRIHNFEELVELWPAILMRIRTKVGVTSVAYLHDAYPVGFTDEEVILEFGKQFHHAKASEAMGRLPFEKVISEVLDHPRRLRLQLRPPVVAEPEPPAVVEAPEEEDGLQEQVHDVLDYTQKLFGAEIMGRSG
jgi:DNA polymerase-3 subunit gamma/tau